MSDIPTTKLPAGYRAAEAFPSFTITVPSNAQCQMVGSHRAKNAKNRHGRNTNIYAVRSKTLGKAGYLKKPAPGGEVSIERAPGFDSGRVFKLQDNSMHPTHAKNDLLVCSLIENMERLWSGSCAVIKLQQEYILKRIYFVDSHILLVSDSDESPVRKVEREQIEEVWRVNAQITPDVLQHYIGPENSSLQYKLLRMEQEVKTMKKELKKLLRQLNGG